MKKLALSVFMFFGLIGVLFADDNVSLNNNNNNNSLNQQIEQEHNKTEMEIIDEECKKSISDFYSFIHLDENSTNEINKMYQDCVDKKLKGIEHRESKIKKEQKRQKAVEEYSSQKEQQEQNSLNNLNANIQIETNSSLEDNSSLEIQNIDSNNSK